MAVTETPPETVDAAASSGPAARRAEPTGLAAVLGSGDHKVIGRLYIVTALIFGAAMVILGALFAFESTSTDTLDLFSSANAFQSFTLFRLGSVFLAAIPLVIGVALVVVPLQVGAASVAFPRAAAASYWAWLVGSLLFVASYAMDGGPGGSSGQGVNLWIASFGLVVVAVLIAAVCLATTAFALRAPGLTLARAPLFTWSVVVASVMWLFTLPVLFGALVLSYVDVRHGGGALGGNGSLYGRIGWVLRNPQIYIVAIPVLGFAADALATTARARLGGRGMVQGAVVGAGIVGFGAVLASFDPGAIESPVVVAMGLAGALPALAVMGIIGDLFRRGSFRLTTGAVYGVSALAMVLLGTVAGALGSIPDMETAGTIFDLGVANLVLLGAVTAALGGVHWWATKIGRQPATETIGRMAPLVLLLGAIGSALPELVSGVVGEGVETAPDWTGGVEALNLVVLVGSLVVLLGLVLALVSLLPLLRTADQVERDPWEGQTLEWLAPSPPPLDNFDAPLPLVVSAEPLLDLREVK